MQGQLPSRKRAAPGASPLQPQQSQTQGYSSVGYGGYPDASAFNNGQFLDSNIVEGLNGVGNGYGSNSNFDANFMNAMSNGMEQTANDNTSNQLVRRNGNQQLAARGNDWNTLGDTVQVSEWQPSQEDEEDLESRAMAAKKEAQAKRKQIPPFVQKLSSFLDQSKNTDLIRWSDDGNSFIVLDEDEFAKTLIPELFKHNNYASFVRQLNMYGFHKRVGLSDNSMKASENKRKTPSEYYNDYFKRGRPDLLWLIQKPKNASSNAKRKKGEAEIDDEEEDGPKYLADVKESTPVGRRGGSENDRRDLITLPKSELDAVRSELRQLQQQQRFISSVISQVKRQNDQLYQQASAFQTLHDRHENSINAILTFLATFYNRSLEGQGGNIADMFNHAIPDMQNQGHVVDVGDIEDHQVRTQNNTPRPKRPLALLPAPGEQETGRASTVTPSPASASNSRQPSIFRPPNRQQAGRSRPGTAQSESQPSPLVKNEVQTPSDVDQVPSNAPTPTTNADQMMSVIQAANQNSPAPVSNSYDFPAALANFQNANGNTPLTPQQKNDMLSMIAKSQPSTSGNSNNALVTSSMPEVPDMSQFTQNQEKLDFLQQMQLDNERRVQSLADRLTPLSPSGTIPGLDFEGNSTLGPQMGASGGGQPPEWDLNDFINSQDYFPNVPVGDGTNNVADGNDLFNFDGYANDQATGANGLSNFNDEELFGDNNTMGFDGAGDSSHLQVGDGNGGRVESVGSSEPNSPATALLDANANAQGGKSPAKRRRVV